MALPSEMNFLRFRDKVLDPLVQAFIQTKSLVERDPEFARKFQLDSERLELALDYLATAAATGYFPRGMSARWLSSVESGLRRFLSVELIYERLTPKHGVSMSVPEADALGQAVEWLLAEPDFSSAMELCVSASDREWGEIRRHATSSLELYSTLIGTSNPGIYQTQIAHEVRAVINGQFAINDAIDIVGDACVGQFQDVCHVIDQTLSNVQVGRASYMRNLEIADLRGALSSVGLNISDRQIAVCLLLYAARHPGSGNNYQDVTSSRPSNFGNLLQNAQELSRAESGAFDVRIVAIELSNDVNAINPARAQDLRSYARSVQTLELQMEHRIDLSLTHGIELDATRVLSM